MLSIGRLLVTRSIPTNSETKVTTFLAFSIDFVKKPIFLFIIRSILFCEAPHSNPSSIGPSVVPVKNPSAPFGASSSAQSKAHPDTVCLRCLYPKTHIPLRVHLGILLRRLVKGRRLKSSAIIAWLDCAWQIPLAIVAINTMIEFLNFIF